MPTEHSLLVLTILLDIQTTSVMLQNLYFELSTYVTSEYLFYVENASTVTALNQYKTVQKYKIIENISNKLFSILYIKDRW